MLSQIKVPVAWKTGFELTLSRTLGTMSGAWAGTGAGYCHQSAGTGL